MLFYLLAAAQGAVSIPQLPPPRADDIQILVRLPEFKREAVELGTIYNTAGVCRDHISEEDVDRLRSLAEAWGGKMSDMLLDVYGQGLKDPPATARICNRVIAKTNSEYHLAIAATDKAMGR